MTTLHDGCDKFSSEGDGTQPRAPQSVIAQNAVILPVQCDML